jgi:hypothetical protein
MAQTGYDKALEIVRQFDGKQGRDGKPMKTRDIKAKIAKQCKITESSASTYFYLCRDKIRNDAAKTSKKKAAKKSRR